MPTGQYFRKVAKSLKVVRANLKLLSAEKRDGIFFLEIPRAKRVEMVQYFSDLNASMNLREVPAFLLEVLCEAFRHEVSCTECWEPATSFSEYECGHRYARCEAHHDVLDEVVDQHIDHECSLACCARGHTGEYRSIAELESLIVPVEIFLKEGDSSNKICSFTVRFHRKTDKERASELEYLMMQYPVKEFQSVIEHSTDFSLPPLEVGVTARLIPNFLSLPFVTLAVVRNDGLLLVEVAVRTPQDSYICTLPKGVKIPGHSWDVGGGTHCLKLSRSDLKVENA